MVQTRQAGSLSYFQFPKVMPSVIDALEIQTTLPGLSAIRSEHILEIDRSYRTTIFR